MPRTTPAKVPSVDPRIEPRVLLLSPAFELRADDLRDRVRDQAADLIVAVHDHSADALVGRAGGGGAREWWCRGRHESP
jgi:hypothetical protein